jgi:NAD(P)-dependent dehydrogenase (short-subunit alcohol dehydrogenase family)
VLLARRPESYEGAVADIKKAGGQAVGITADVSDPTSLKNALASIEKELPGSRLAAAVFNVNSGFARKPFLELKAEEIDASLNGSVYVNLDKLVVLS